MWKLLFCQKVIKIKTVFKKCPMAVIWNYFAYTNGVDALFYYKFMSKIFFSHFSHKILSQTLHVVMSLPHFCQMYKNLYIKGLLSHWGRKDNYFGYITASMTDQLQKEKQQIHVDEKPVKMFRTLIKMANLKLASHRKFLQKVMKIL